MPERTKISLEICQPLSSSQNLFLLMLAEGRTVWIKGDEKEKDEYLIGVKFIRIAEKTRIS